MKGIKLLLFFIVVACFWGCDPAVTFTTPQPDGLNNLSKFPKRLHGQYYSLENGTTLIIKDKVMYKVYEWDEKRHPNQLDIMEHLEGDTLIDLRYKTRMPVKRDGDSLIIHYSGNDTLFQLAHGNVLRKYKGYYFMNTCYDKTHWEVHKVRLKKGQLSISEISTEEEIELLKEIAEASGDTIAQYNFSATKRQFREFVTTRGFSSSEVFVKTNKL